MNRKLWLLILLIVLAWTTPLSAQGTPPGLERAREVQQRHSAGLMAHPGVVGTAVALNAAGQPAVVILAERPGVQGLPAQLEGLPVVVEVTGTIYALGVHAQLPPSARFPRPVPIGVSTGHPSITAGTIGARVTDGTNVYALSNNHVYAAVNRASVGDAVIQPGTFDGGALPGDFIGTLTAFEPIVLSTSASNIMDAAIAVTTVDLVGTSTPAGGYGTPTSTVVQAVVNMPVQKFGRTTGQTSGTVSALNAIVNVCYANPCQRPGNTARFVNQLIITPGGFSAGGDSGSLVVDSNRNPVALLFAGSSTHTIASPIGPVLARFGVSIDTSTTPPPPSNTAPTVTITSPTNGLTVQQGTEIQFTGTAADAEDGNLSASLVWASSIDGPIGSGGSFATSSLSVGTHTITASVTDSGGLPGSASISVTVNAAPSNTAPTVTISSPANNATFDDGTPITFTGSASDAEQGDLTASLVWTSNLAGPVGEGGNFSAVLPAGTHTITASVTDNGGLSGSASITVTVNPPPGATLSVTGITPNTVAVGGTVDVTIVGTGFAPGASLRLQGGEGPTPSVTNVVVVNPETMTASIATRSGGPPRNRVWDVVVTNPGGATAVLDNGFTVTVGSSGSQSESAAPEPPPVPEQAQADTGGETIDAAETEAPESGNS